MKKLYIIIIVILLGACDHTSETKKNASLIPLTVGTQWEFVGKTYHDAWGNPLQNIIDTTISKIHQLREIDGIQYAVLNNSLINFIAYQLTDSALYTINYFNNSATKDTLDIHKYPTKTGDQWTVTNTSRVITVVSTSESITVPAGTFQCIKYRIDQIDSPENYYNIEYLAVGVGFVRFETWTEFGLQSESDLQSYTIK